VELREGAGLRTPFLGGTGAGVELGALLDGVGLGLLLKRAPEISCGFADGRLRGKSMSIGLRGGFGAGGEGAVSALGGGGTGVVSLERLEAGQTWSPSWSRGTGCEQEEHLTVGRSWDKC
jgi:hypothetical protein